MAPVSCFKIFNWQENKENVNISRPEVIGFFTREWNQQVFSSLTYPKFFDNEAIIDVDKINSEFNECCIEMPLSYLTEPIKEFKSWRDAEDEKIEEIEPNFITTRDVLVRIMTTPFQLFSENPQWIIYAKLEGNIIHLYMEDNEEQTESALATSYDKLKRYLFKTWPIKLNRHVNHIFYQNIYEVLQMKIGNVKVMYSAECPGIISDEDVTSLSSLSKKENIYCDIFEVGEFSDNIIRYNPIWWSKAQLINAKRGFIGAFNKNENRFENIYKYESNQFEDIRKFENLWSPDAVWNFLNLFLCYVKQEINFTSIKVKHRNSSVWKFSCYESGNNCVNCEILIEEIRDGVKCYRPLV